MAKAVQTEDALPEDLAEFLGLGATQATTEGLLSQMTINTDDVDSDGNEVEAKTFHIKGTKLYSKAVKFRPIALYNRLLVMRQEGKAWEVTNETIFFQSETPIDAAGGVACGRILSKRLLDNMTEAEKKLNKQKANWYSYAFGEVEFPTGEKFLVDFRMPGGKAKQYGDAIRAVEKETRDKAINYSLNMKLIPEKGSQYPKLDINPDLSKKLSINALADSIRKIKEFVEAKNNWVVKQHTAALAQKKQVVTNAHLLNDLNDEIPFGDED